MQTKNKLPKNFTVIIFIGLIGVLGYLSYKNYDRINFVINEAQCSSSTDIATCRLKYVTQILQASGPVKAFDAIEMIRQKDKNFTIGCHGFAHSVGVSAFPLFLKSKNVYAALPSDCETGYYHGLLMEIVMHAPDIDYAKTFCLDLKNKFHAESNVIDACYHGIGHGLPFYFENQYKNDLLGLTTRSLKECNDKFIEGKNECEYGVYGGIATLLTGDHGIKVPTTGYKEIFSVCQVQNTDLKKYCYDMFGQILIGWVGGDPVAAIEISERYVQNNNERAMLALPIGMNMTTYVENPNISEIYRICSKWSDMAVSNVCLESYLAARLDTTVVRDFNSDVLSFCQGDAKCRGILISAGKDNIPKTDFQNLCKTFTDTERNTFCK